MKLSEDIIQLLQDKFNKKPEDLQNMSKKELELLKSEVEDMRHE